MDYDVCFVCNLPYEDKYCKPFCEDCKPEK